MDDAYMVAGIACLLVLLLWLQRRSEARHQARRNAVDQRIRDVARAHIESGSTFGAGVAAALEGTELWENPHCTPIGLKDASQQWHAGWCYGRKLLQEVRREVP